MKQKSNKNRTSPKSYWLYLHPYVHAAVKTDNVLLYNTLNGQLLEYGNNTPGARLIKRLNADANLYVIKLKEVEIDDPVRKFIDHIRQFYMGDIIDTSFRPNKPIQLKPMLSMQNTLDYMTSLGDKSKILVKDEIKDYLNVITLYINNRCRQSCPICKNAYKQFTCCFKKNDAGDEICINDIRALVKEIKGSKLYKFNIVGGNILHHSTPGELAKELNRIAVMKEYFIHYLNIEDNREFFHLLESGKSDNHLNIIVHFPLRRDMLQDHLDLLNRWEINKRFHLVIQENEDISTAEELISEFQIEDSDFVPYYNGNNLKFFKENVFLNREAIMESKPSMNDIFARMTLNTLDFKRLTILGNKDVYANMNHPKTGRWGRSNIFDLIFKELHKGKSWTKVRKHVTPCKSCVFNALCPPISNYEYAIGRYDLCDMK